MVKMKEQSNELFFAQVKEPVEIRRNILETLKEILEVLQRFEKFKHIRQEKLESINKLRNLLKDANKMLGNLKLRLPQTNLRVTVVKETSNKKINKKNKKVKADEEKPDKPQKKEATEIERLEAELSAIEDKLTSLT